MGLDLVAQWVKRLPSAQVMISGSWDRAPCQAPCSAGESASPFPLVHALSLSLSFFFFKGFMKSSASEDK